VKNILFFLLIIGLVSFICIFFFTTPRYGVAELEFSVSNTKGWFKIPNQSGMEFSLSTKDPQNNSVSFIGIGVINHIDNIDLNRISPGIADTCKNEWSSLNITFVGIEKVSINELPGLVCIGEGKPAKIDAPYTFKMYTIQNKKGSQHDYIISVSYPENNKEELARVNNVINSFKPYYSPIGIK